MTGGASPPAPGGYDLAVAYRVYPGVSKAPVRFADDKLRLAETCLRSFATAVDGLRVKVWALLDGCGPEYAALFRSCFADEDLVALELDREGNQATFQRQIDILLGQDAADLVYFAEDDYLYAPGALAEMVELIRANPEADFVSPYDHADYYQEKLHRHPVRVHAFGRRHWRTANSTCLTFLTRRETLRKARRVFETYSTGNSDFSLWLSLTKLAGWNPLLPVLYRFTDRRYASPLLSVWRRTGLQMLFGPRFKLWVPIPSLATHMESTGLAPVVEWEPVIDAVAPR
jgi:hypothetical protein